MSDIYLQITETPTVVTLSAPVVSGALAATVTVGNTVTVALDSNSLSALENVTVTVGAAITGTVTISNFPATQAISGTVTANGVWEENIRPSVRANADGNPTYGIGIAFASSNDAKIVGESNPLPVSGTVTIGAGTAQIGSVTASISGTVPVSGTFWQATQPVSLASVPAHAVTLTSTTVTVSSMPAVSGSVTLGASTAQIGSVTASISGTVPVSGTFYQATQPVSLASLPALVAGTAQIGSVTASLAISSSAITSGSFTSLTSATLVPANTARKMATVYNLGAGQLFINAGATATTLGGGFMVALSSGDFYECDYTTTTLSAIFATAGTASWISH
jgi:hypothetical protein